MSFASWCSWRAGADSSGRTECAGETGKARALHFLLGPTATMRGAGKGVVGDLRREGAVRVGGNKKGVPIERRRLEAPLTDLACNALRVVLGLDDHPLAPLGLVHTLRQTDVKMHTGKIGPR